jgi:hypothetical protein
MKNFKLGLLLCLIAILLYHSESVNGQSIPKQIGQDNYGSICNLGRQIRVIKNKYVVEFIVPIGWQRDISQLKNTGVTIFFPEIDSIKRKTNIYLSSVPEAIESIELDSFINNEKAKNPDIEKSNWEIQKNIFHPSVSNGKSFLIEDHDNNVIEYRSYILSDQYTMTFVFKSTDTDNHQDYERIYETFLSSIRCSVIVR